MAGEGSEIHKFTQELINATKGISSFGESISAIIASRNGLLKGFFDPSNDSDYAKSMRKRQKRIEFERHSSSIRDIIKSSNELFEADEFMKAHPGLYGSASERIEAQRKSRAKVDAQYEARKNRKTVLDPSQWKTAWQDEYGFGWEEIFNTELDDALDAIDNPERLRKRQLERRWGSGGADRILEVEREKKAREKDKRYQELVDDLTMSDARKEFVALSKEFGDTRAAELFGMRTRKRTASRKEAADDYILGLSDIEADQEKLRDKAGRKKWGSDWGRVKKAEDEKRRRDEKHDKTVWANTKALLLLTGTMFGGIKNAAGIVTRPTEEQIKLGERVTKWENVQATIGNVDSKLRQNLAAQGFETPESQFEAIRKEYSWLSGLATGHGVDRFGKLSRNGLDISGVTSETSVEDFYRIIGSQLATMKGKAKARAINALGWDDNAAAAAIAYYQQSVIGPSPTNDVLDQKRKASMYSSGLKEYYTRQKAEHPWYTPSGLEARWYSLTEPLQSWALMKLDEAGRNARVDKFKKKNGLKPLDDPFGADYEIYREQRQRKREADEAWWNEHGGATITNDVGGVKIDLSIPITAGNANATQVYEILRGRLKSDVEEVVASAINSACETMEFVNE